MDLRGARLTLGTQTFKHAKPSDFNDVEDLSVQALFPGDLAEAVDLVSADIVDVLLEHLDDAPSPTASMRDNIAILQAMFRAEPAQAEYVKAELAKEGPIINLKSLRIIGEEVLAYINDRLQETRVLCVTTHRCSERMWVEYAANHSGIALRIVPRPGNASKFNRFHPVVYRET